LGSYSSNYADRVQYLREGAEFELNDTAYYKAGRPRADEATGQSGNKIICALDALGNIESVTIMTPPEI
jgi:hypothetical protein